MPKPKNEFEQKRKNLVQYLKDAQAIVNPNISRAFLEIPREQFVLKDFQEDAYSDNALPGEKEQTISQPRTISAMLEMLNVEKGMNVLEVGSGTGYVTALLSCLVGKEGNVFGIDIEKELVEKSQERLKTLNINNVTIKQGDGALGWEEKGPFDRVLVSCACPFVPPKLFRQLKERGRIVAPVGDAYDQQMTILEKFKGKIVKKVDQGGLYQFVPLRSSTLKGDSQAIHGIRL
jgi:protein-L-isoaspartate(D-aspartate) O-methyltransferase